MINNSKWLNPDVRYWWTRELLRDFRKNNPTGYHQFLWSNHLGYALSYKKDVRFGNDKMVKSREIFFSDLRKRLQEMGIDPSTQVRSVLEVGCSLGYQLRFMETDFFTEADILDGVDIDHLAIERGTEYLQSVGSKVKLFSEDMVNIEEFFEGKRYDLIVCTGVLMYLDQGKAAEVVKMMLRHSNLLVGLSGPAHLEIDNQNLEKSDPRETDGAFIHNLDSMVTHSGGRVLGRRWEGTRFVNGQTLYFVFATTEPLQGSQIGIKPMKTRNKDK